LAGLARLYQLERSLIMAKTVVGLFDSFGEAQRAMKELVSNGFKRDEISLVANQSVRDAATIEDTDNDDVASGATVGATSGALIGGAAGLIASLSALTIPVVGPILAAGPLVATLVGMGAGAVVGGLIGALVEAGVPEHEARLYEEGVKRGGTLLTIHTTDDLASKAASILNRHNVVDIKSRSDQWRSTPTSSQAAMAGSAPANTTASTGAMSSRGGTGAPFDAPHLAGGPKYQQTTQNENEVRMPVVEEDLKVGKREKETGGVRITPKVTEKPVEQTVNLHEEKVNVQRRPVDRPASPGDFSQKGETIEMRETREEPVIQKQARVVEEVVVNKEEHDRAHTVRDTVRRKDVDVQQLSGQKGEDRSSNYDTDFRSHFQQSYGGSGSFDDYSPAYQYGSRLANDQRYLGKDWSSIQSDARRDWETNHPNTWDKMKDAVQYGWNKVKAKVS
jgi:uncharacterized protein (TIGR02271 family)